ncbi:MAG: peptidoglycan recognition protein family protein [Gemmatirosa sp.]
MRDNATNVSRARRIARAARLAPVLVPMLAAAIAGCRASPSATPSPAASVVPATLPYVSRAAWGAAAPVLPMRTHAPQRLTIHHTGVAQAPQRTPAAKLRALQQFSQRDDRLADGRLKRAWADVPYHFYVTTDGSVVEGREWRYVGDTNTPYDPTGHLLVVVEGNFEVEALTDAQRRTLDVLVPALARRFGIPGERLAAHRDFAATACPGRALYAQLPHFRTLVDRPAP